MATLAEKKVTFYERIAERQGGLNPSQYQNYQGSLSELNQAQQKEKDKAFEEQTNISTYAGPAISTPSGQLTFKDEQQRVSYIQQYERELARNPRITGGLSTPEGPSYSVQQPVSFVQQPDISTTTTATTTGTKFGTAYKFLTKAEIEAQEAYKTKASGAVRAGFGIVGGFAGVAKSGLAFADRPVRSGKKVATTLIDLARYESPTRERIKQEVKTSFKQDPYYTTGAIIGSVALGAATGKLIGIGIGKLPIKNVPKSRTFVSPELSGSSGGVGVYEAISRATARGKLFGLPVTPARQGAAYSGLATIKRGEDVVSFIELGEGATRGRLGTTPKLFDFEAAGATRQIGTDIYQTAAATKYTDAITGKVQGTASLSKSGLRYENELGQQYLTRGKFAQVGKGGKIVKPSKFTDLSIQFKQFMGGQTTKEGLGISVFKPTARAAGKPLDFEYLRPAGQPATLQIARPVESFPAASVTQAGQVARRIAAGKTAQDITGLKTKAKTLSSVVGYSLGLGTVEYQQARQKPGQPTIRQQRYENAITGFTPVVQLSQQKQKGGLLYANDLLPKTKQRSTQAFLQAPAQEDTFIGQIQVPTQITPQLTGTAQQFRTPQMQIQVPRTPTITEGFGRYPPFIIPKLPIFGAIGEGYLQRGGGGRQANRYQASLVGLLSGKKQSKAAQSLTGLEVRYPVGISERLPGTKRKTRPLYSLQKGKSNQVIKGIEKQLLYKTRRRG